MTAEERNRLTVLSCQVRMDILKAVHEAASGHIGGSMSAADILVWLYFRQMHVDPSDPGKADRDRFVLSKGHAAPALYAVLAERGFFPREELSTLRKLHSRLQGHPNMNLTPGVDMTTGSLGQGVSAAAGLALAMKLTGGCGKVYTLLGDGELQEGQVWEAFMFSSHHKLSNLCILIDRNRLQIDGRTQDVMCISPVEDKLKSFGLTVYRANGHRFSELEQAFSWADCERSGPCAIVLDTVKGKGVSFMENNAAWHGKAPNDAEYELALSELEQSMKQLREDHNDCIA